MPPRSTSDLREPRCTPAEAGPTRAAGLHVGSDDPHVLQLDDDRVARSRKRPTFSLRSHKAATPAELAQSLNGSMDRSSWPEARLPRVHQVAEAAAVLQTVDGGSSRNGSCG
jgi:hypothetical protein